MATQVQVGQRVRINEKYGEVGNGDKNEIGTEFVVTKVTHNSRPPRGHESELVLSGDPNGWGMWGDFVDVVPSKAHTTTLIPTSLSWSDQDRMVKVTSGTGAISLSVQPNPAKYGDISGSTTLTPDQAEELAHDLLARVAEIREGQK